MKQIITIGSRESKLAIAQTEIIMSALRRTNPDIQFQLLTLKTTGDKILDRTLDQVGGKGLFVKELDEALLSGKIDLAVHSLKDMPMIGHPDLPIAAFFKRGDPRDALIYPENGESEIKILGTSSARRRLQAKKLFPNAECRPVRGNINTRLDKLDRGEYSALILAAAGLIRGGFKKRIGRVFSSDEILPAAGQGILAIQCRKDFDIKLLESLNHRETEWVALAERSFVRTLDGGCSSPTAAYAEVNGSELQLTGLYADPRETVFVKGRIIGNVLQAEKLGMQLAEELKGKVK